MDSSGLELGVRVNSRQMASDFQNWRQEGCVTPFHVTCPLPAVPACGPTLGKVVGNRTQPHGGHAWPE